MKYLIINADDLGLSEGVNHAVFDLHEDGLVTSTSLLVHGPYAQSAVLRVKEKYPKLSLGLHLDFGRPPFRVSGLAETIKRQWGAFLDLVGECPTHVDIHNFPGIAQQITRFVPVKVPIRDTGSINYINKFNGVNGEKGVGLANLIKIFKRVKKGVYELCCHPSYEPVEDDGLKGMCGGLRQEELKTFQDARVKLILGMRRINLISYLDIVKEKQFRIHTLDRFYSVQQAL